MKSRIFLLITLLLLLCASCVSAAQRDENRYYEMFIQVEPKGAIFVDSRKGIRTITESPLVFLDIPTSNNAFLGTARLDDSDKSCNVYFIQGATAASTDASVVVYWIALEYDTVIARIPIFYDFKTGYMKQLGVFIKHRESKDDLQLPNKNYAAETAEYAWLRDFVKRLDLYRTLKDDMERSKYMGRIYNVNTKSIAEARR